MCMYLEVILHSVNIDVLYMLHVHVSYNTCHLFIKFISISIVQNNVIHYNVMIIVFTSID